MSNESSINPDWDGIMRAQAKITRARTIPFIALHNDDAKWWTRMNYLFRELPFEIRHRWGGDAKEMVEGIDAAINKETEDDD